jgi:type II secretory pathway pseudopilin PulG
MKRVESQSRLTYTDTGFTLVEVLVALAITMIVMAAVFGLLVKGQTTFEREPEVADLNQNIRVGLDMISRDLALAGYKAPPAASIVWNDGGGITPDELTIIYAVSDVPVSEPICQGGPECNTIDVSAVLHINPTTIDPQVDPPNQAYQDGMLLMAIETGDRPRLQPPGRFQP